MTIGKKFQAMAGAGGKKAGKQAKETFETLRKKGEGQRWSLPDLFVCIFTLISFLGTFIGLRDVLSAGDQKAGAISTVMVFLTVFAATGAMVWFLNNAKQKLFSVAGIASGVAYLALMLFSVTFGFAFYWSMLSAKDQAFDQALTRLETFQSDLGGVTSSLESTKLQLSAFATHFEELATVEMEVGGTCGDQSAGGPGPRTRHRKARAAEISTFSEVVTPAFQAVPAAGDDLAEAITAIRTLKAQSGGSVSPTARSESFAAARQEMLKASRAVNAISSNGTIRNNVKDFRQWADEYRDTSLVRTDQGPEPYKCISTDAANQLDGMAETLSTLPTLEVAELPDWEGAKATREAVDRMVATLGSPFRYVGALPYLGAGTDEITKIIVRAQLEECPNAQSDWAEFCDAFEKAALQPDDTGGLRPDDRMPLLIALIVDGLLFLFTIARKESDIFGRWSSMVRVSKTASMTPLDALDKVGTLMKRPNYRLLSPYVFTHRREFYLAQPLDRSCPENEQIVTWVTLMRHTGMLANENIMKDKFVRERLRKEGSPVADNAGSFIAWRFNENIWEEIIVRAIFREQDLDDILQAPRQDAAKPEAATGERDGKSTSDPILLLPNANSGSGPADEGKGSMRA